jgi:DNA recombination protein RmuC
MDILLIIICILQCIGIVLLIIFRPRRTETAPLQQRLEQLEHNIRQDLQYAKSDNSGHLRDTRMELLNTLQLFQVDQQATLLQIKKEQQELVTRTIEQLERLNQRIEDRLGSLHQQSKSDSMLLRDSLTTAMNGFQSSFEKNVQSFNQLQREKFDQLQGQQTIMIDKTAAKLEEMRQTVDEKLQKTLHERLGQSFEMVGKQLESVQKGLGEMQTLANDVGGLKKVLSNVKLRGGIGEVQLGMLLEQMLAPGQYESNVRTRRNSTEPVEFAIKLPGRSDDENSFVYLPIDAKFPKDAYEHLIAAYENAIPDDIEAASKNMEATIKRMARDIRDKYIDPPQTTDFAIMFLPFESIYAEVIRRSSLVDQLREEFRVTVAGPTTLAAILNSLQMGFRSLALQKRSSDVWKVLASVKNEFENFGGMLEKAQKNIQTGLGQLEDVVGARTRAIRKQLKEVENAPSLPEVQNPLLLDDTDLNGSI